MTNTNKKETEKTNSEVVETKKGELNEIKIDSPKLKKAKTSINLDIDKPDENGDIGVNLHVDFSGIIKGLKDMIKNIGE